ncbi:EAL domain-containing protein [Neisseriaceae bacterium JH1-16]|nr:EAL domain-containing protein [Neisseriaceae bacterium JH1-16]
MDQVLTRLPGDNAVSEKPVIDATKLDYINRLLARHGFESAPLTRHPSRIGAHHEDWRFRSVFQPIFSLRGTNLAPHALEALARVADRSGSQFPPTLMFAAETSSKRTVFLDRLLRSLHLLNFLRQSPPAGLSLFLNVNAQHLVNVSETHGSYFADVLAELGVPASQICLEVVEDAVNDPGRLLEAVKSYRNLGFRIALDDFGQGASNLERVWLLEPDYVKLDKRLMRLALMRPGLRDTLTQLVEILHLHGAQVISEGIESGRQLDIAREAGCDYAQGFHLAMPIETLQYTAALGY